MYPHVLSRDNSGIRGDQENPARAGAPKNRQTDRTPGRPFVLIEPGAHFQRMSVCTCTLT